MTGLLGPYFLLGGPQVLWQIYLKRHRVPQVHRMVLVWPRRPEGFGWLGTRKYPLFRPANFVGKYRCFSASTSCWSPLFLIWAIGPTLTGVNGLTIVMLERIHQTAYNSP